MNIVKRLFEGAKQLESKTREEYLALLHKSGYGNRSQFEHELTKAKESDKKLSNAGIESSLAQSVINMRKNYLETAIEILTDEPKVYAEKPYLFNELGKKLDNYKQELKTLER